MAIRMKCFRNILFGMLLIATGNSPSDAKFLTDNEAKSPPRPRIACLPTPTFGTRYLDPDNLSPHAYNFALWESDGIVYTCRGGHIDLTHLRKTADWTAYLAYHIRQALLDSKAHLAFKMHEPSRYQVRLQYPHGWKHLLPDERQEIARDASVKLGQYLAYVGSAWHEILTWYGYKGSGFFPEYHSSFSWEDNYSNALGSYIGVLALRDAEHDFVEAMALLIERELQALQVQPKGTAKDAAERVRGSWFTGGYLKVTMVKRHLDVGLDNGMVMPWLIPNVGACHGAAPKPYPVPTLAPLEEHEFHVTVEIEPREWERNEILRVVYPNPKGREARIEPAKHFGAIIEDIRATAVERYGPRADECGASSNMFLPSQAHHSGAIEDRSMAPDWNDNQGLDVLDVTSLADHRLAESSTRP